MRICHLMYDDLENPWLGGGGAVRAREIYRRLAPHHDVTLITGLYPGAARSEERDGVHILRVGSERGYALSRMGYMWSAPRMLGRLRWDIWVHEFSAFAPLWVPRRFRRRGVLQLYHFVGRHALHKHPLVGLAACLSERDVVRRYPHVITISPSVERKVRRLAPCGIGVDCVATGVDARYFELRAGDEPYILYLGRTDIHTKGLDLLVEAFARVAGDDPDLRLRRA